MYVARILSPIVTLGPGKRLVLWTKGCSKKCHGCISPELADTTAAGNVEVEKLASMIRAIYAQEHFEGITISGGDPLEQLPELIRLLEHVKGITDDVLVYTGFVWREYKKTISAAEVQQLERLISVLIDGPYIEELNEAGLTLRGSVNQQIIFFDERKRAVYEEYLKKGRTLQNVYMDHKLVTVGIMDRQN